MALFAIGDTHLSLATGKSMNIFGGWTDYEKRLENNWRRLVRDDDTVVIAGDISWCMNLEEGLADFQFLDSLPGKKIILKGNHDYWWATKKKSDEFFEKYSLKKDSDILTVPPHLEELMKEAIITRTMINTIASESDENYSAYLKQADRAYKLLVKYSKGVGQEKSIKF